MNKTILGVDVGMAGALAFYDKEELIIYDMPVFQRNKTKRVDCHMLHEIIKSQRQQSVIDHVFIEQVNAFKMGATGAYNFGWSCGVIEAVVACHGIPFTTYPPSPFLQSNSKPIWYHT